MGVPTRETPMDIFTISFVLAAISVCSIAGTLVLIAARRIPV